METLLGMNYDLVVVGGGAAGFFGAIQAAELNPGLRILILEKSTKLLSKVRISGGGRCNVTHNCFNPFELSRHYPRGEKLLKVLFKEFNARDVVNWFAEKGVLLKSEPDGRMFPVTDDSMTIIDCFLREAVRHKIRIETKQGVVGVQLEEGDFYIQTDAGKTYQSKAMLVATGGNVNPQAYRWISNLGHTILKPIPSLFTFLFPMPW
jgi:predicted Rossmann fold flavoprotein